MTLRNDHEVLTGLYGQLLGAARAVSSDHDFHQLVATAATFQRYSPINRLYLAVQGAKGAVANQRMWDSMPAVDGHRCRVRPGEQALRVLAPIHSTRRTVDPDTGRVRIDPIGDPHYRMVPVFHEDQLVAPPAWPIDPPLAFTRQDLEVAWTEIAEQLNAEGLTVHRVPGHGDQPRLSSTNRTDRRVAVRDDIEPAEALRALVRELAAVRLRMSVDPAQRIAGAVIDVEAESVSMLVARRLKIDMKPRQGPAIAPWEGRSGPVSDSAERVLVVADRITSHLETALACDLTSDGFQKLRRPEPTPVTALRPTSAPLEPTVTPNGVAFVAELGVAASADEVIGRHLAAGGVRWEGLGSELPGVDTFRFIAMGDNTANRAVALAEAGASAGATADVLVAAGVKMAAIAVALQATVVDAEGDTAPLFDEAELRPVLRTLGADPDLLPADEPMTAVVEGARTTVVATPVVHSDDPIGDDLIAMWSKVKPGIEPTDPTDDLIAHWSAIKPANVPMPAVPVPQPAQ